VAAAASQAAVESTADVLSARVSPDTPYMMARADKLQQCMRTCNPTAAGRHQLKRRPTIDRWYTERTQQINQIMLT
jgi:hypothetical protein